MATMSSATTTETAMFRGVGEGGRGEGNCGGGSSGDGAGDNGDDDNGGGDNDNDGIDDNDNSLREQGVKKFLCPSVTPQRGRSLG